MSDRDLLQQVFDFLKARTFVAGDEASVRDMVKRYRQPPLTLHFRAAMQLTTADYDRLGSLLAEIQAHLEPQKESDVQPV